MATPDDTGERTPPDPSASIHKQLRIKAFHDYAACRPMERTAIFHSYILERAVKRVLSTAIALDTFAQIVDGLPTYGAARQTWSSSLLKHDRPLTSHVKVCTSAVEKAKRLLKGFNLSTMTFSPDLLRTYLSSKPRTLCFDVRLIELVACSLHQVAVYIFQQDLRRHEGPVTDLDQRRSWARRKGIPPATPTLFIHSDYYHDDIYPHGVANIVGYWAEDRIMGGVAIFDRKAEYIDASNPSKPFLHSTRESCRKLSRSVWQLTDIQYDLLIAFLLSETGSRTSPLPLTPSRDNHVRYQRHGIIERYSIYRNLWERGQLETDDSEYDEFMTWKLWNAPY